MNYYNQITFSKGFGHSAKHTGKTIITKIYNILLFCHIDINDQTTQRKT